MRTSTKERNLILTDSLVKKETFSFIKDGSVGNLQVECISNVHHRTSWQKIFLRSHCPEVMIQILPMAFLCIEVSGLEVRTFLLKISWFCWKPVYWALPRRVHPVKSMGLWSHFTMTKSSPKTFLHQSKRTEVLICAFLQQKHPLQGFLEDNCFTILCYFLLYNNICDSPCLQNWDHISLIYLPSHHISENLPCSVCVCVCVCVCEPMPPSDSQTPGECPKFNSILTLPTWR